jgi:hypothetical protein
MKALRNFFIGATALVAVTVSAKDAKVTWDPSADAALTPLTYNLFIYTNNPTDGTTNGAIAIYTTTNLLVTITNLNPSTLYYANVNCQDTNGLTSDQSNTASFLFPAAPKKLRLTP